MASNHEVSGKALAEQLQACSAICSTRLHSNRFAVSKSAHNTALPRHSLVVRLRQASVSFVNSSRFSHLPAGHPSTLASASCVNSAGLFANGQGHVLVVSKSASCGLHICAAHQMFSVSPGSGVATFPLTLRSGNSTVRHHLQPHLSRVRGWPSCRGTVRLHLWREIFFVGVPTDETGDTTQLDHLSWVIGRSLDFPLDLCSRECPCRWVVSLKLPVVQTHEVFHLNPCLSRQVLLLSCAGCSDVLERQVAV